MVKASPISEQHTPIANGSVRLEGLKEHHLLSLFVIHFELQEPAVPGKHYIAKHSGRSLRHVEKCLEGKAHLGILEFHELERASGTTLLTEWLVANHYVSRCQTCPLTTK